MTRRKQIRLRKKRNRAKRHFRMPSTLKKAGKVFGEAILNLAFRESLAPKLFKVTPLS